MTPPQRREPTGRGVPDGALLGFLATLLGVVQTVWLATGLGGLLQHGSWPGIQFKHTALALRRLITDPGDLEAAWSHPDPAQGLPSTGVFWTILGIMVVLLLAAVITALVIWSRFKAAGAVLKARREAAAAEAAPAPDPHPFPAATQPSQGHQPPPPAAWQHPAAPPAPIAPAAPPPGPVAPWPTHPYSAAATAPAGVPYPHPLSEAALFPRARAIRPDIPVIGRSVHDPLAYGVRLGRDTADGTDLYAGLDQTLCVYAPPGDRTTARLVQSAVIHAPGPVLVTCTGPATVTATAAAREKLGPVLVFDPLQLTDAAQRLRWSPVQGCEDPAVADTRARALLEPVRPLARTLLSDRHTQQDAHTLLRCWLHAAALDHRPVRQVHRWAGGQAPRDAVKILRTTKDAAADWAGALESLLSGHPQQLDSARALTVRALESLSQLHVLNSCTPSGSETLKLESFLRERGTIYLVGEAVETRSSLELRTHPGAMPLLTALAEDVVEHGRRVAARSPSGRLDPPLLCALDDVATLAPVPVLPDLMSVGGRAGLPTIAVLRSEEEARHRWGERGATTIHHAAGVKARPAPDGTAALHLDDHTPPFHTDLT